MNLYIYFMRSYSISELPREMQARDWDVTVISDIASCERANNNTSIIPIPSSPLP